MQSSSLVIATESPLVLDEEPPRYATLDTFSHLVSAAPIAVEVCSPTLVQTNIDMLFYV